MNSVTRKLTLGLAVAIAATACGDNVTVKQQGPPPATVRSVVVSPSSATIAAGSSFTFGAAVDADSGLSRAVTWTAAGGTGITVDANGVATSTATATGVASVCATSVANTAIKGCAQLTVNAVAAATVQIDVITYGCDAIALAVSPVACNLQAAVTPSNIAGEVDVQALVNRPAGSGQQNVVFQVLDGTGTTVQDSYTQTLLADVDLGAGIAAQQTTNNRVTQAIQTAKYDLTGTGGIAKVYFPNGQHVIRVCLSATPNTCAGSGTTAVALTTLTFRNANGFHVTTTTNLASGNNGNLVPVRATTAAGLAWNGGTGLALKAVPVSYTGTVPAAVTGTTVGFGSGCDLVLGARGIAATITGGILTGSLPYANVTGAAGVGIAGAANLNQYEMNPACGGESPFATANDATGNSFINFSLFGPFGANNTLNVAGGPLAPTSTDFAPVIRLDNRGPSTGALTFTDGTVGNPINGRTNAWVNGDVVLNGANTGATSNGAVLTTPTDAGFGGTVSRIAHLGTAAACNNAANCLGQPTVTQASSPTFAETVTNTTDAFNVEAQDVFGNRVVVAPQLVGLDFTAPTIANNGSPADAAVIDAAATNFSVNVADALSGFAATGSVSESVVRVNGALGGLTRTNVVGTGAISATPFATAGTAAAPTATFLNTPAATVYVPAPTLITTTLIAVPAASGYYIHQARAKDLAGNVSTMWVRRIYFNNGDIPAVTGINSSLTLTGGAAATFPATASAATEVTSGEFRMTYPNVGTLIYSRPTPAVDPTFDDNMPMPAPVAFSVSAFVRGIQAVSGGNAPQADLATAKPTGVAGRVYTPFGNSIGLLTAANPQGASAGVTGVSADFVAPVLAAQVPTGVDYSTVAAATVVQTWTVGGLACGAVSGGLKTCTFTVTARGATGTFLNPFGGGVQVLEAFNATTNWRVIGGPGAVALGAPSAANPAGVTVTVTPNFIAPFPTLDNGVNRDFVWTVTLTRQSPGVPANNQDYRVVGLSAAFDGLATNIQTIVF